MAASTDNAYFVGQGYCALAPRISGGAMNGGFIRVGDFESAQVSFKQNFVDVFENNTGYGFNALHAPVQIDADIKLSLRQWSSANLEKALWGAVSTTQAGGTVTGETLTAYNGTDCYLQNINVSAVSLTAGATPLVAGTDYTLDGSYGRISILPGSTVVPAGAGVVLTAGYTYAPNNGNIGAFGGGVTEFAVQLDVKNVANPFKDASNSAFAAVSVRIHRVLFDATKMMDFIGKKETMLELDGKVLIDPTIPFTPGDYKSVLMNITRA